MSDSRTPWVPRVIPPEFSGKTPGLHGRDLNKPCPCGGKKAKRCHPDGYVPPGDITLRVSPTASNDMGRSA